LKKVLIITYYWPPSGGSGVQRWMYFAKYLSEFGIKPYVLTVDPAYASYKFIDKSFEKKISQVEVYRTLSSEPFTIYSKVIGKKKTDAIPQGFSGESNPGLLQKAGRFIRGNFFIPDARKGWIKFALQEARKIISQNKIDIIITTGPPHSTHLIGLKLKKEFDLKWVVDFRDPWTEVFYNKLFYRTSWAINTDRKLEKQVLNAADKVLTIGPSMAKLLQSKVDDVSGNSKVQYIFNGYDQEVFKSLVHKKDKNQFTICHLGILTDNQPVDGFIEAMKIFFKEKNVTDSHIKLLLIGRISPGILDKLKSALPGLKLEVIDYLSHEEAMQQIMNADLLFNSLADVPDGKYLISGKLMEYIATGNPVLCLGDESGDAAMLLNEFEDAKVFDRKNINGMHEFILNIFKRWKNGFEIKRKNSSEKYSRYKTAAELAEFLKTIN
jgi:glycosyltransferase involved in cell wall biosynthesis